tara:strand:+ start:365 stop:865 length:501 start_codon:yes stop_codon:yes gene_type:complete
MTDTSYMIEDFKELLKDYEYLKADNAWCRGEMTLREELTEKYMQPKTIDVKWLYTTDRWFRDNINSFVKQWIVDNHSWHNFESDMAEDDEWITFYHKGRAYDINVYIPDDLVDADFTDIRAVAYGVKFDGVSLQCDMENEHVLKDVIPSRRRMDQQDIINKTKRGE